MNGGCRGGWPGWYGGAGCTESAAVLCCDETRAFENFPHVDHCKDQWMDPSVECWGGGKKEDHGSGSVRAIFMVDFHCDGCTEKICQCIKGFKGVEGVKVERDSSELTVVGSMDPQKLLERIKKKTNKKVELINPKIDKNYQNCSETQKCEKEKLVLIFSTVVLKIYLHCEGCSSRIYDTILKIDGVEQVTIDRNKSQVTIQGTMKTEGLADFVSHKIRKPVELLNEKINRQDDATCHANSAVHRCSLPTCHADVAIKQCGYPTFHADVAGFFFVDQWGCRYGVDRVYGLQIFSDENPNACSVM